MLVSGVKLGVTQNTGRDNYEFEDRINRNHSPKNQSFSSSTSQTNSSSSTSATTSSTYSSVGATTSNPKSTVSSTNTTASTVSSVNTSSNAQSTSNQTQVSSNIPSSNTTVTQSPKVADPVYEQNRLIEMQNLEYQRQIQSYQTMIRECNSHITSIRNELQTLNDIKKEYKKLFNLLDNACTFYDKGGYKFGGRTFHRDEFNSIAEFLRTDTNYVNDAISKLNYDMDRIQTDISAYNNKITAIKEKMGVGLRQLY